MSDPTREHPHELLSAYLDDELGVEERAGVDRHLADCEACREDLASLRRLAGAVAEEEVPPVPADLAERIGARIDAAKVRPFRRRIVVPVTIAATLAAVGLVVVYQWTEPRPIREARQPAPAETLKQVERDELAKSAAGPAETLSPRAGEPAGPPTVPPTARQDRPAFAPAPAPELQADKKADVAGAVEGKEKAALKSLGYVSGVAGGAADRAASEERARAKDENAMAPPAANRIAAQAPAAAATAKPALDDVASPCGDRWVDTGVVGTWVVGDMQPALRDLDAVAARFAGRGSSEPVLRGEPYEIVAPRARYAELLAHLRAKGVTGIDAPATLPPGDACVRQRISIQVVLGTPPR
jgi:hypothetical protein